MNSPRNGNVARSTLKSLKIDASTLRYAGPEDPGSVRGALPLTPFPGSVNAAAFRKDCFPPCPVRACTDPLVHGLTPGTRFGRCDPDPVLLFPFVFIRTAMGPPLGPTNVRFTFHPPTARSPHRFHHRTRRPQPTRNCSSPPKITHHVMS